MHTARCEGKIELHHNLIFAGRQVNAKFCILPLCKRCHDNITLFKEKCDWIMLNRATPEEIILYSKACNYQHRLEILNQKYGSY
jgi:hypothetical protein